jgi:hypothetical protein
MSRRHFACSSFYESRLTRRDLLRVGGLGMLGMTMPKLLQASELQKRERIAPKAKSVIFLFQWGGPSHIDMFDMKPDAPREIRGPYKGVPTSADGIQICEHLPNVAKVMDKVTLVRSVHHTMKNHNSAGYYALTGHSPIVDDQRLRASLDLYPGYASVVDHLAPNTGEIPTSISYPYTIADGSAVPGQRASFLGKKHDPLLILEDPNSANFKLPQLSLPEGLSYERLTARRELQQLIDGQSRLLETSAEARGLDDYYHRALGMLDSTKLREAFDLSKEPDVVREAYGRHTYGQSCLLARRLVESGTKFVTAYYSRSIGGRSKTSGGWDTHGFDNTRMFPIIEAYHLPMTDQTYPTLLNDLEDRGLLDETLVVWMGEFGRTPKINGNVSRDHWPQCYTAMLAGGGIKRGYVHGASDKVGAYPADKPVRPDDLAATIFYLLGIDPKTEVHDVGNRPIAISAGEPIMDIIA